jgi:type IV pilus assembly protein PilQ
MLALIRKNAGASLLLAACGLALGLSSSPVMATELKDLSFAELPGERAELRLQFSDAPVEPKGYSIEQPARVVLDFPNVGNSLKKKRFPISIGAIDSAVVVEGGNRTRLIVNMSELAPYSTRMDGNELVLELGGGTSPTQSASAPTPVGNAPVSPKKFNGNGVTIENIDFRRGESGEGRIIVDLSDPSVAISVEETAKGVEVEFFNANLPQELRRKLDVTDFATPVTGIAAGTEGSNTVLRIATSEEFDYLAYQADDQYVLSVKPITKAEQEQRKARFAYTGEKLSLNFQDIAVRNVLQIIADFNDLNLVASDTVTGNITLRLDSVPWDQALDLVLKTKGLAKRQIGNVLLVAPAAEIAERERQELAAQKQLEELAPLRTEYIRVRYANARELFNLFVGDGGKGGGGAGAGGERNSTGTILSERGSAIVDERTNSIILTDTEEKIAEFRRVIDQVDIPIRQVMIEARIVVANTDFAKELGIRWGGAAAGVRGNKIFQAAGSQESFDVDPGSPAEFFYAGGTTDLTENTVVDLGVFEPVGSLAMSVIGRDFMLDMELSALESSGYAEIVSQPKVITGDKQQATIASGTEIPYQEASASGATTTAFKEAVLKLDVTPQITPDDNIIMNLIINQDSVGALTNSGIPTIDVTELVTQVLVADGQTVVLGGIYQTEQVNAVTKVPVLGDVPYLGRLFRNNVKSEEKREILIFITPRLMKADFSNNF